MPMMMMMRHENARISSSIRREDYYKYNEVLILYIYFFVFLFCFEKQSIDEPQTEYDEFIRATNK